MAMIHVEPTMTNRPNRLGVALVLAALVVVGLIAFGGGAAANGPLVPVSADSVLNDSIEVYIVQPGDTLWDIAGRIASDGGELRPIIDNLKLETGGADLDIGQRIIIDHSTIRS